MALASNPESSEAGENSLQNTEIQMGDPDFQYNWQPKSDLGNDEIIDPVQEDPSKNDNLLKPVYPTYDIYLSSKSISRVSIRSNQSQDSHTRNEALRTSRAHRRRGSIDTFTEKRMSILANTMTDLLDERQKSNSKISRQIQRQITKVLTEPPGEKTELFWKMEYNSLQKKMKKVKHDLKTEYDRNNELESSKFLEHIKFKNERDNLKTSIAENEETITRLLNNLVHTFSIGSLQISLINYLSDKMNEGLQLLR